MEFSVEKGPFLKELNLIQGVIEKKNTIPILSFLMLTAKDDHITLIGTDMDLGLRLTCPAQIKAEGTVLIQAKRLFEIVRSLPDASITVKKSDGDNISIKCERYNSRVIGQSPENFPSLPASEQEGIKTDSKTMYELISKTIFAVTTDESRFALAGTLLIKDEKGLTMVATDAHRLAIIEAKNGSSNSQKFRALIPKKSLAEFSKLLLEHDGAVVFCQDENHLFFKVGPRLLVSRLLSGQFPNYQMILPTENNNLATIDASALSSAIRRVALMADERSKAIRLNLEDGTLELKSHNSEAGEATETLPIDYSAGKLSLVMNAQYMTDFLNVASDGQICFDLKDAQSQVLIRPANQDHFTYRYVAMPMRV